MELIWRMLIWFLLVGSVAAIFSTFPFLGWIFVGAAAWWLIEQCDEE